MTNKEAVAILRSLQDWLYYCSINGGAKMYREAIDVAIKALTPQPVDDFVRCKMSEAYDQGYEKGLNGAIEKTLEGYDIEQLKYIAAIMHQKGISAEAAIDIFAEVKRCFEVFAEEQTKILERALTQWETWSKDRQL